MKDNHMEIEDDETRRMRRAFDDDYVASAPDCRAAVMARIRANGARRPVWAYACAAAVLVGIIVGSLALRGPSPQPRKLARSVPTRPATPPVQLRTPPQVAVRVNVKQPPTFAMAQHPERRRRVRSSLVARFSRAQHASYSPVASSTVPEIPTPEQPKLTPIAAVVVTWPSGEPTTDISYKYRERDAVTGVTTECSVKRSGDSIEIRMESTPSGEAPPVRGSLDNENKSNA